MAVRKRYFSFGMVMTITLIQVRHKSKFKEPDLKHSNGDPNEKLFMC
jgi:hypothetical protein